MGFFKYKKHDQIIYIYMNMNNYPEYLMIKLIELYRSSKMIPGPTTIN